MAGIGDLVANLTVNNTGFSKGLNNATSQLRSFGSGVTKLIAPVAGALAGIWGTSSSLAAFRTQLDAEKKLNAVITATGGAAGLTSKEIAAYASELQGLTNFGDEATISAAAMLGSFTNIKGDVFKGVLASAQDLSAVMGTGLNENVKKLGKAFDDPAKGMASLAEAGVTFSVQQQEQIKLLQETGDIAGAQAVMLEAIQSRVGGSAAAMADPWTQFQNTLGDVAEMFGTLLAPSIAVVSEYLNRMTGSITSGADWFRELGIEAAVIMSNMGGLVALAATQWQLFFTQLGLDAVHLFTDVIPSVITWFADNWQDILFTAVDYTLTLFINLGKNIREMWSSVLEFIQTGEFNFDWTPLLEGARSTIKELPDIPERMTTEFEKSLMRDIDTMASSVGESMAAQREELAKQFMPLNGPGSGAAGLDAGGAGMSASAGKSSLKASFAGSSEAASILLRGLGGPKSTEQLLQKSLTVQQGILAATKSNKQQPLMVANLGTP